MSVCLFSIWAVWWLSGPTQAASKFKGWNAFWVVLVHYGCKWVFGVHTKDDEKPFLLLSARRLMLCPEHPFTQTHIEHKTKIQFKFFISSCTNFEWHLICATVSAKGPLLQLVWSTLCAWVPMCAEYLRLCMHVCKRTCVRAETGCCEKDAQTPSSPLSHWLTAERLKVGKPFQTVGLNDGRYSDPSTAHYNNTIQTSHQQPCHLDL